MFRAKTMLLLTFCRGTSSMSMGLMGSQREAIVWLMCLSHVRCVLGLLWLQSMLALMSVLLLLLKACQRGYSWPLLGVQSVVHRTWTRASMQASSMLATYARYVDTGGRRCHQ